MNGSLVTAILGGIVGDTLAILALVISLTVVTQLIATHRRPSSSLLRTAAIGATTLGVIEATVWSLAFHNAYDAPNSWCWTCAPILDALGETTENMLTMILLGASIGLTIGMFRRSLRRLLPVRVEVRGRRWWYRHVYLNSAHWQAEKAAWWTRHPQATCIRCGQPAHQHHADLHHLTYAHIGHELDRDLVPIHRACHMQEHGH